MLNPTLARLVHFRTLSIRWFFLPNFNFFLALYYFEKTSSFLHKLNNLNTPSPPPPPPPQKKAVSLFFCLVYLGLDARNPVFEGLQTAKAQTSLRIRADWWAPLLCYALNGEYQFKISYKRHFTFLAGLCSCGDWFESRVAGNPDDRFCRVVALSRLLSDIYAKGKLRRNMTFSTMWHQRLRPACAYAQSDQSLCLSLEYSMIVKLLTKHHLELTEGCTCLSEYTLVKMPHCWKSHVTAVDVTALSYFNNVVSTLMCSHFFHTCRSIMLKWAVTCDSQQCGISKSVDSVEHVQPPY